MREEGRAVARQLELGDEGLHDEGALAAGCVPAAVVVAGNQVDVAAGDGLPEPHGLLDADAVREVAEDVEVVAQADPLVIWFTSDLHLGHRAVLGFCSRPWETVEQMDAALVASIHEVPPSRSMS